MCFDVLGLGIVKVDSVLCAMQFSISRAIEIESSIKAPVTAAANFCIHYTLPGLVMTYTVVVDAAGGYPPFLPQLPAHLGLPPELCARDLLPLGAAAALNSISPGSGLPYSGRPPLV